ncbi:MAG: L-2-amino-thiazoline-4-carboxylic acid hydrolase [Candidatus Latescibacteria bacterium]|nr:L-2-amino-thiazoline-4-carboxylic acid hydrolase [Candidatus Latescibacterota bacterium]
MSGRAERELTLADHQQATVEVSFLLDIFAETINDLMGGATASVGRIAGRNMAKKLPVHLATPDLDGALKTLAENLRKGFEISYQCGEEGGAEVHFARCAIREVCAARNLEQGGALCKLFHYYTDGIVNEILFRPVRSEMTAMGEQCTAQLEIR